MKRRGFGCALFAAGLALGGCGSDQPFDRAAAVERVVAETDASRAEAECIVDGVLGEGLVAADFLADADADPRFARVFERVATGCLL